MRSALQIDTGRMQRLTSLLDEEIVLLDRRLGDMDALCEALLARDNDRMADALQRMETTQNEQQATERRLDVLRAELARDFGWTTGRTRLSSLLQVLEEPGRSRVAARRDRLLALTELLRSRHIRTTMLLAESARVNRMLLQALLGPGEQLQTYDAAGSATWRTPGGLLNTEL